MLSDMLVLITANILKMSKYYLESQGNLKATLPCSRKKKKR